MPTQSRTSYTLACRRCLIALEAGGLFPLRCGSESGSAQSWWESSRGSGGTDWPAGTSNSAVTGLDDREVLLEGGEAGLAHLWTCHFVEGFAGRAAKWIELEENSGIERRPVPSSGAVLAV